MARGPTRRNQYHRLLLRLGLLLLPDDFQNNGRRVPVAIQAAFGQFRAWHCFHRQDLQILGGVGGCCQPGTVMFGNAVGRV